MEPRSEPAEEGIDELFNRLGSHGLRYFDLPTVDPHGAPAPVGPLAVDLARSHSSRVRSALVALLLRHPEYASSVERAARELSVDDPSRHLLLLSIVVAAALQREWSFTLGLYLGDQTSIDADHLAAELRLPPPGEDFGRLCLVAAGRLLGERDSFPVDYRADWENAARRLMAQLVGEAGERGS
jgi:hypothetical protein